MPLRTILARLVGRGLVREIGTGPQLDTNTRMERNGMTGYA